MALRERPNSEMAKALEERKQKTAVQEMITGAREATNAADKQKEKHYAEMIKAVQKKDYKMAERHAKMYIFMDKLSAVSREYEQVIEDQKAMSQMFGVLEKMNASFGSLMTSSMSADSITSQTVKNFTQFKKYMAGVDDEMDRMLGALDGVMGEPSKKGRFGKGKAPAPADDEASFLQLIGGNKDLTARYQSAMPSSAPASGAPASGATASGAPASRAASSGASAPSGAPAGGRKDGGEDGFVSVGRPD